jgi:hypothetical protein
MGKVMVSASAQTLLLLSLWDLDGLEQAVSKGQVVDRVKKKDEKMADYTDSITSLEQMGAIELSGKRNALKIVLKQQGLMLLGKGLRDKELEFAGSIMRSKIGNALLRWIREMGDMTVVPTATNGAVTSNGKVTQIDSYETFKAVALETFDKLNQDFNLDNLVPIYRIRRTIGEQIDRNQFNNWLLQMQAEKILRLQGGSVEDSSPDKIEDSVQTEISGLRCYAKRLAS